MSFNETRRKKIAILQQIFDAGTEQGLTPRMIAARAGFHPNQSAQFRNPTLKTLRKLAHVVGGEIEFVPGFSDLTK